MAWRRRHRPRLATPLGIAALPRLEARWTVHRAQTAELLGDAVIDALAARLRRHLRPSPRDPSVIVALPELDTAAGSARP